MSCNSLPFQSLPFPALFKDYISQKSSIVDFFSISPFSDNELKKQINNFRFQGDRKQTVRLLKNFNLKFKPPEETLQSIEKFADPSSLAVVTGQQLSMFGGPLFTIYKLLTVITLSRKWQKKYNRPFIPVFWLADEDHDYDEIAKVGIPESTDFKEIFLDSLGKGDETAGDLVLDGTFPEFRKAVEEAQPETDFSYGLWNVLDEFYASGESVRTAFGRLLLHLFGKYGLVLAGSNDPDIKKAVVKPLQKSVIDSQVITSTLSETTERLIKSGYHGQVQVQESNLFWIDGDQQRKKIHAENGRWFIDDAEKEWTTDELTADIEKQPERFSPNVFLRPLVQDTILPAIAYAAGPGEVSYYAQMKEFYSIFGLSMPVVYPRFSGTVLESGIERILKKLPFSIQDYNNRIEDLESRFVKQSEDTDVETLFDEWKKRAEELNEEMKLKVGEIDPTLEGSAGKVRATYFTELDKLKGKIYRSIKQQEKVQLERIRKIKNSLFPNRNLQEREVAFIYLMNKYGPDIWDTFLDRFEEELPDSHKIIRLHEG